MSFATFSRDGLALRYCDQGDGMPVLFQHGLGGDEAQVADVFPAEPAARRITLECRGQGASPFGPEEKFSMATFAEDLDALAAWLGLSSVVVGGISMGAAISLRLAVRKPQRVRALILARPAWVADPGPDNMHPYAHVGALLSQFPPAEARRRFEASDEAVELARLAPDNLASLRGFFDRPDPGTFGRLLRAISGDGPGVSESEIAKLRVPALVIGHDRDLAHPLAFARRLAELIPQAELREITPKAVDRAAYTQEFRHGVSDFLRRLDSVFP